MRNRILILAAVATLLLGALLGCSLGSQESARVTATPTKTQRPLFTSTFTPTPSPVPSDTPVPTDTAIPPTETSLPTETPQPTDTPAPTLEVPTDTPIPATETPAAPTNTAPPRPTNTPLPPTSTPKPAVDFRITEIVAFEDGSLTVSGLHNIYLTVVDASGGPLDGIILEEVNNDPHEQVVTGNKGPGKTEFTMWAGDYRFKVVGNTSGQTFNSETTHVLSIVFEHAVWDDLIRGGICTDEASCRALGPMHFSYNVTFQRTW
ncbi:MAG: hypothetical protein ACK2UC_08865 [Anaerolineae bacterium]|jgi:hypothetical protein